MTLKGEVLPGVFPSCGIVWREGDAICLYLTIVITVS